MTVAVPLLPRRPPGSVPAAPASQTPPILAIVGPTAVGKTDLAVEVARRVRGEVIGLDSRQIYAGLEIGTAQPGPEEQARVPHHLFGSRRLDEPISAGEYAHLVDRVLQEIESRRRQPVICGGAGLYYRALTRGIFPGSVSDLEVRARLETEYSSRGPEPLLERLRQVDPEYAQSVHPNNKKRLIRALEIYATTGKGPSWHFREQRRHSPPSRRLFTVLATRPLAELEERIARRTEEMLAAGWVEEVQRILSRDDAAAFHPLDSIGYRQIRQYLDGQLDSEELVPEIVLKTRQYAKRQLAWFRHESVNLKIDLSAGDHPTERIVVAFKSYLKNP